MKPDLSDEDKPFQCSECTKRFTREDNGKVHIKRAHGGYGTIVSKECVETEEELKRKRPKRALSQQLPSVVKMDHSKDAESMDFQTVVPSSPLPPDTNEEKISNEVAKSTATALIPISGENPIENTNVVMQDDTSNLLQMNIPSTDLQVQQDYIRAEDNNYQHHKPQSVDLTTKNDTTSLVEMLHAAENLSNMPEPISKPQSLHGFKIPKRQNNKLSIADSVDANRLQHLNHAEMKKNAR